MKHNLISEDIYLRILEETDLPVLTSWMREPEINKIMGYLPNITLNSQQQWFNSLVGNNSKFVFAICLKLNNEYIGNVGLGNIDYINRNGMFNIFIANSQYRGRGIGEQASRLILDFAFNRLNLHKVYLQTSVNFEGAVKMYERIGFKFDGILREHYFVDGKFNDKLIYSLLKKDFIDE